MVFAIGIRSSAVGLKICAITAGIKKYKTVIQKKKKKHKIVLLAKNKVVSIELLISRALINSYIGYDEYVSGNNVLREYADMKKEIKNLKTSTVHQRF